MVRLFILLLISRNIKFKTKILVITLLLSYIYSSLVTYIGGFNAVHEAPSEVARHYARYDPYHQWVFYSFQANFGSYLIGMITAFIYVWSRENRYNLKQSRIFMLSWRLHYATVALLFATSYIFQTFDFEKPTWWIAVITPIFKNYWAVLTGITILGYDAGLGGVVRDFLSCKLFRLLGQVVFAYYLVHMIVVKIVVASTVYPLYLTTSYVVRILDFIKLFCV